MLHCQLDYAAARKNLRRAWRVLLGPAAITPLPKLAHACSVCFSAASPRLMWTYYLTTVAMIVLPLAIVAMFGAWLRRRFKDAFKDALTDSLAPLPNGRGSG
jgi:hypothetical protein